MSPPDLLVALRSLLIADATVNAITAGRVFQVKLPAAEAQHMPRGAIVLARAGGRLDYGYVPIGRPRVDVRCYGAGDQQAWQLWSAVHQLFKQLRPTTVGDTRIHSLSVDGPMVDTVEPEVNWPLCWSAWLVTYNEVPIPA